MRGDEDSFGTVSQNHVEQLVAVVHIDRDDAVGANVLGVVQRGFLDYAFTSHHQHMTARGKVSHRNHAGQLAIRRDTDQVDDRLSAGRSSSRSEEHTSELQSPCNLVCRLLLEKKNIRQLSASVHTTMM